MTRQEVFWWIRIAMFVASAYFLCSAFCNLREYSTYKPEVKVTDEDVYIRGIPVLTVFNSLFWGGAFSLSERFLSIVERALPRVSKS